MMCSLGGSGIANKLTDILSEQDFILILSFRQAEEPPQVTQDLSLVSSSQNSLKHTVPESTPNTPLMLLLQLKPVFICIYYQFQPMAFIPVMEHGTRLVIKCNFAHGQGHIFNCVGVSLHTCFCTCYMCIRLKVHTCAFAYAYTCI